MKPELFCQSCTMPIDDKANRGTEADGSLSSEYCKYCYQDGHFIQPDINLDQMKTFMTTKMQEMHLPESVVQYSLQMLPHLKRWSKNVN